MEKKKITKRAESTDAQKRIAIRENQMFERKSNLLTEKNAGLKMQATNLEAAKAKF